MVMVLNAKKTFMFTSKDRQSSTTVLACRPRPNHRRPFSPLKWKALNYQRSGSRRKYHKFRWGHCRARTFPFDHTQRKALNWALFRRHDKKWRRGERLKTIFKPYRWFLRVSWSKWHSVQISPSVTRVIKHPDPLSWHSRITIGSRQPLCNHIFGWGHPSDRNVHRVIPSAKFAHAAVDSKNGHMSLQRWRQRLVGDHLTPWRSWRVRFSPSKQIKHKINGVQNEGAWTTILI